MHSPFPASALKCPACRVPLITNEQQGIRLDQCPQCEGAWLDRRGLKKLAGRGAPTPAPPPPQELGGGGGWLGHFQFPSPDRGFGRKPEGAGKRWRARA